MSTPTNPEEQPATPDASVPGFPPAAPAAPPAPPAPPVDQAYAAAPAAPTAYPVPNQPYAGAAPVAPPATPGKGLAIVGFVLAFLIPPVGAIISIIALVKLNKSGGSKGLAIAGIILGVLFTIGWIIFAIAMAALIAGAAGLIGMCAELGPGVWDVDGTTITCS